MTAISLVREGSGTVDGNIAAGINEDAGGMELPTLRPRRPCSGNGLGLKIHGLSPKSWEFTM